MLLSHVVCMIDGTQKPQLGLERIQDLAHHHYYHNHQYLNGYLRLFVMLW